MSYYPKFHKVINTFAVEVCEGDGTPEYPMSLVYYIHTKDGKLLGKIDKFGITNQNKEEK